MLHRIHNPRTQRRRHQRTHNLHHHRSNIPKLHLIKNTQLRLRVRHRARILTLLANRLIRRRRARELQRAQLGIAHGGGRHARNGRHVARARDHAGNVHGVQGIGFDFRIRILGGDVGDRGRGAERLGERAEGQVVGAALGDAGDEVGFVAPAAEEEVIVDGFGEGFEGA